MCGSCLKIFKGPNTEEGFKEFSRSVKKKWEQRTYLSLIKAFWKWNGLSWKVVSSLLEESGKHLICDDGENKEWDDLSNPFQL